jgi:hypothetical protein
MIKANHVSCARSVCTWRSSNKDTDVPRNPVQSTEEEEQEKEETEFESFQVSGCLKPTRVNTCLFIQNLTKAPSFETHCSCML